MAALHTDEAGQLPGVVQSWGQVGQVITLRGRSSSVKSPIPSAPPTSPPTFSGGHKLQLWVGGTHAVDEVNLLQCEVHGIPALDLAWDVGRPELGVQGEGWTWAGCLGTPSSQPPPPSQYSVGPEAFPMVT